MWGIQHRGVPLLIGCCSLMAALLFSEGVRIGAAQPHAGSRPPAFVYSESSGCDGLFVYAWNEERTEVLTVRIDRTTVPLRKGTTTLRLEQARGRVQVRVEVTDQERSHMQFCADERLPSNDKPVVWEAQSGTLKVSMAPRPGVPFTAVNVSLEQALFTSPDGAQARSRRDITFTAAVAVDGPF